MDGSFEPERGRTEGGDINPDKVQAEIADKGRELAEMRATRRLLSVQLPQHKAVVVQRLLDQGTTAVGRRITRRDAEELALLDKEYVLAQETLIDAGRKEDICNAEFKAVQARWEAMRTAEATRRAEIHSFR